MSTVFAGFLIFGLIVGVSKLFFFHDLLYFFGNPVLRRLGWQTSEPGFRDLLGAEATVSEVHGSDFRVKVNGVPWQATTTEVSLVPAVGERVVVVSVQGLILCVARKK